MPIIRKDNLFKKIDFDFSIYIKELLPENQIEFFTEIEDINSKLDQFSQKKQYGTTTYFFFFLLESINVFIMPLLKKAEQLSQMLRHGETQLQSINNPFQRQFAEKYLKQSKAKFILYKILLEDISYNNEINLFYNKLLVEYIDYSKEFIVPQHYFTNYIQYQVFMSNIMKSYYQIYKKESFQIYLKLLQQFLSERFKNSNQNVKAEFMDLLFTLNIMEKGKLVSDILVYIKDQDQLDVFLKQLLGFYSNIDFLTDHDGSGRTKFRYRYFCSKFLNKALENERYVEAFKKNQSTQQAVDFLGNLLTDLNYFIEDVFQEFEKIKELEEQILTNQFNEMNINEQNQENEEINNENQPQQQLQKKKDKVKQHLKFGKTYLKLFEFITKISPNLLNNEDWAQNVALVLNYYAQRMCTQSYIKYKFSGIKELGFRPLDFIKLIVSIYFRISDCQLIKEEIVKDERCYKKEILIDIGTTAMKKNLVSWNMLQKFELLIRELEILRIEKEQYNNLLEDCPDKYTCQISYEIMKDPVKLPASGTIVDFQSIKKHITLSGQYDPFNRDKLTLDMVEHLNDLKIEIEDWKNSRLSKFRKKIEKEEIKLGENLNQEIEYQNEETNKEEHMYDIGNKFQVQINLIYIQYFFNQNIQINLETIQCKQYKRKNIFIQKLYNENQ